MEKEDIIIELIRNLGKDQQRLENKLDTEISKMNTELSNINNKIDNGLGRLEKKIDTESVKVNTELSNINNKINDGLDRLEKKIDTESIKINNKIDSNTAQVNNNIMDMKKDIRWKFKEQDKNFGEIKEILVEEKKRVDEIYTERKKIKITWSLPFVWFNAGISACIAFVIGIWK